MRKSSFITYIVLTALAVTTFSCSLHEEYPSQPGSINLEFKCSDLLTRADGDPETAIESIDYFIYTSEDGSAVYHNRITTTSTTAIVDNVPALASEGAQCFVYAVANLPSDVSISGTETIDALQAISVTTDFTAAQTSFVMDSEEAVSTTVGSSATVPLHRLAAKLTMTVNIPVNIVSGSITYEPDYSNLRIYYVNAVKKGTFDGTYMTYGDTSSEDANKANYFLYPYDWAVSVTGGEEQPHVGTTVTPFYTYPQSWEPEEANAPYFKVVLPWAASGSASNSKPYYYKVVMPNSFDGKIDRNTFYKFVLDIGVLGSEVDDGSVEVLGDYYVVDWSKAFTVGGDNGDEALTKGKYLSVAQNEFSIYAENGITIPVTSSHNLSIESVTCSYTDYSSNDPTPRTLTSGFTVTPNDRSSITLNHNLVSDVTSSDLDCSIYTFTITIANEANCSPLTVTVTQYPSLYITSEASNKWVFINKYGSHDSDGWGYDSNYYSPAFKIINDDGGGLVDQNFECSFSNYNSSYSSDGGLYISFSRVNNHSSGGLFPTYYGKRFGEQSWVGRNYPGTMTITAPTNGQITGLIINYYNGRNSRNVSYDPSGNSSSKTSWSGAASSLTVTMDFDGNNDHSNVVSSVVVSYSYPSEDPEALGAVCHYEYVISDKNKNYNNYTINVSNLSGNTNGWYIADPRKQEAETIDRLRGQGTGILTGYHRVDPAASNAIAPQFKIASSVGATTNINYDQAVRRCASYQENGYPAGRWRIPTDAEIRFVISLSNKGKIPSLFDGAYWAASGAVLNNQGNSTGAESAAVRCVYDSWYWGDKPMSQYMTTWSGFQTD